MVLGGVNACAGLPHENDPKVGDEAALAWLVGCWRTEDGETEERWVRAAGSDYLFGYSTSLKDSKVSFFEQLRLEPAEDEFVFFAYPRGVGPTRFSQAARTEGSITFENLENDYPQRITYKREGGMLNAEISKADGTNKVGWKYSGCP